MEPMDKVDKSIWSILSIVSTPLVATGPARARPANSTRLKQRLRTLDPHCL
jgi:hypothetical protein